MEDQNDFYQNIYASLIDGVILVSHDGCILNANNATEEMFRQSLESFAGKCISELIPDQPDIKEKIKDAFTTGTSFRDIECLGFRKINSTRFPLNLILSPFLSVEGKTQGVVMQARDMSLIRELEETSRQLEHVSNLGVLSLGMAHEIKNPLVAIGGSAQLLRSRLDDPEHKEFLDVVIEEVNRINRMVERMLGLARPGKLKVQKVNIHKALEEILLLEKQSFDGKISFEHDYDPSLPPIEADEDQLKQVFINLIRNAIEAMPDGGKIKTGTRFSSTYSVKTRNSPHHRHDIIIEIADKGVGISEDNLKKLFTPFHTTKSKGNGLGLPISLKIIEDHQGTIKILSQKDEGTTVQVYLPVRQGS